MDDSLEKTVSLSQIETTGSDEIKIEEEEVSNFARAYVDILDDAIKPLSERKELFISEYEILIHLETCIKPEITGCESGDDLIFKEDLDELFKFSNNKSKPFTFKFLKKISCSLGNACFIDKKSANLLNLTLGSEIARGSLGIAYEGNASNSLIPIDLLSKTIILKLHREKSDSQLILQNVFTGISFFHEIFVGMIAINNARQSIPNFIYTYGYINCDNLSGCKMIKNQDNTLLNYPISIIEYVNSSKPLKEIINNISLRDYVSIFLQIILSLRIVNERFNFVHLDLHLDNVLIQEFDRSEIINYPSTNSSMNIVYKNSDFLARIIDYGYSKVKVLDQTFCDKAINFPQYLLVNFINDIYKFLGFSLMFTKNLEISKFILKLFFSFSNKILESFKDPPVESYIKILSLNFLVTFFRDVMDNNIKNIIGTDLRLYLYYLFLKEVSGENVKFLRRVYYYTLTNLKDFNEWLLKPKNLSFTFNGNNLRYRFGEINYIQNLTTGEQFMMDDIIISNEGSVEMGVEAINKTYPDYNTFIVKVLTDPAFKFFGEFIN